MTKQIWLSPVLGKRREQLVKRCSEMITTGAPPKFLYLAASHPLLELVTKWILDFDTIRGVWGTLPVYLFRGFVREVLTNARTIDTGKPLPRRTSIDVEDSQLKHSLLSQIMRRLVASGDLRALRPLAHRDGTINTIATLIGEIQRAGTTPEEFQRIVETRAIDFNAVAKPGGDGTAPHDGSVPQPQATFDREIGMIYEAYARALDDFDLTEEDADQLRALKVLKGEISNTDVTVPWLDDLQLLVLDGFFDFTPVQGEMLRALIPRVPQVIVNLYGDQQNREVFIPFADTIEQLRSISDAFKVVQHEESQTLGPITAALRSRLFNPEAVADETAPAVVNADATEAKPESQGAVALRVFRCNDRETEVRAIAKEIKRLVLVQGFSIRDIALVVRQRAAYSETIARVFVDEAIPCTVEHVVALAEVPAVRAILKLFQIIASHEDDTNLRVRDLADLIKSGYFQLSARTILELRNELAPSSAAYASGAVEVEPEGVRRSSLDNVPGPGEWDPDALENVLAYVGSELRLDAWLERARRLASYDSTADEVRKQIFGGYAENVVDESEGVEERNEEEPALTERKSAPTREVLPVMLEWSALVLREFAAIINRAMRESDLAELRSAFLTLLDELQFSKTIRDRLIGPSLESALPHAALDLRALDRIRLAISAAHESFRIAANVPLSQETDSSLTLSTFVNEIERCIGTQSLRIASADRDGVQVLEATDVRGLRFRAVFIAGLIEGGFPLRKERDWIYPHEERERLKQYGLTLEDISPATLLKEEHYFYQAACRATDALYLSWPLVIGGNETVVSYYIDEVRHALAPMEIVNEDISSDFEGDRLGDASSKTELATSLIRLSERQRHHGRKTVPVSEDAVDKLLAWAKAEDIISGSARARISIGRERMGNRFGSYDGLITNQDLRALLSERFGASYVWSASALSLYGKSPFKFFAERVLKLEQRIEAALDLAALDAGGLLHEALRRFFTRHCRQRLGQRDRQKLRDEMRRVASAVFDEHERAVPPLNVRVWEIDREIYQLQLAEVVDHEIAFQEKADADGPLPTYFELGFGMARGIRDETSTSEFLTLERDDSSRTGTEAIRLRGQIDRIDLASDGTVIAYDYKSSRGAAHADMLEGRDLQIAIYLEAVEKLFFVGKQIAGGGYYVLRGCDRNRGLYRKELDSYTGIGTRVSSRVDESEWLADRATMRKRIWQFVDAIRAGRFVVKPTAPEQTCDICDFATVCRFEKFRILRKQ
ncbi:MAG: ATP-dependent helicase/nuclease subunit [Acidobacteriota bacterium]|nr:ATP-dependent helicase/nuclease subunit [Acidobacteriota bacterium]